MDGLDVTPNNSPLIQVRFHEEKTRSDNLAGECRNLITVLSQKIETLCHECDEDTDRVTYIRSLTASLITLNSLLRTLEQEQLYQPRVGIFEDAQGFKYISVRTCDLERFSAK